MNDDAVLTALLSSPTTVLVGGSGDGTVNRWSPGATRLYGWTEQEILGQPLSVLVPPDRRGELARRERLLSGEALPPFETVRLAKDGTLFDVEIHGVMVRDEQGEPIGTVSLHRDLRREHRAEVALQATEAELRTAFADSPVPQSRVDLNGRILAVNAAMEALLGEPAGDVIGRDALERCVETDRPALKQALASAIVGAVSFVQHERTLLRSDGQQVPIIMTVTVVRDADGRISLAVSVEDITELKAARERVRAEADRFEAMLASMPVTVFTYDLDGVCTSSRGQALKLLGVDEDEFVGAALPHLGTTTPAMRDALLTSITGGEVQLVVDLADRVWECHYRPVRDTDGAIQGGIGIAVDVTTRVRAEREVRANEARLRALLREADDVVVVIDVQGRLMYVSPAVCRVLGYDDATLFWHPAKELNHPDDRATVARAWREVLQTAGSAATFVCRVLHEDGSWRWCEHVITNLIADPDVGGMVVNLRDISERRRAEHEVQRLALHDALTGLPNRFLLLDRIGQALTWAKQQDQRTGLILVGVVGMTRINELLGHVGGDAVLRSVGERLSDAVRATDSVARVGGDKFAVLIEDVASAEDLRARAATLLSVAQGPFALGDVITEVHLRVGSAMCPAVDAGSLLSAAERALTQANGAPGIVVAQVAVEQDGRSDRAAQAELRRAVEQGELRLHFQPVLSLSTGEVAGAEALVRWQHPERGLLPPSEFIPLAESSGLIVEVGTWVLREACTRLVQWQTAGQSFGVGINLSPRQMVGGELIDVLCQILDETGASADQLILEVTESAVMDDPKAADVLRDLRGLGVKLALDDFGTGYSSLTYLRRFPIDAIKIDRSFVSGLGRNGDDEAIVASVVSLGRAVGKILVAEGVETAGQLHALRALGVDQAQGFLWSAALPAEELVEWAVDHTWSEADPPAPPVPRSAVPDPPMGGTETRIVQLHEQGASLHTIAAALNAEGSRTAAGPRWTTTTVARIVAARIPAV